MKHSNNQEVIQIFDQFTGKKKPADKTGIQNDILKSETKESSKILTSKKSRNLNGLTNYLSEFKSNKLEEEYKVCKTTHL